MDVCHGALIATWEIRHALPGRIRAYHPAAHRRKQICTAIDFEAAGVPGILSCHGNPTTGTVLVHYEPTRLRQEQVIEILDAALELVEVPDARDVPGTL